MTTRIATHYTQLAKQNTATSDLIRKANSSVMGINDVYLISCVIILTALPFAFLLHLKKEKVVEA